MLLTLMRHGQAEPWAGDDHTRTLTEAGKTIVAEVARGLKAGGWVPGTIVCSPLLRSQQTADVVAEQFPGVPVEILQQVVHTDDTLLDEMSYLDLVDPVIVGHEPGLSRLAARLIGADGLLAFDTASVACFRIDGLPPRRPAQLLFFAPPSFANVLRNV